MDRPERREAAAGIDMTAPDETMDLAAWLAAGAPAHGSLRLRSDEDLAAHYPALARQTQIIIEFPAFTDGRGFSHGRKLRQAGFEGPLIAEGDILSDQWEFLRRCGFSAQRGNDEGGEPEFSGFSVAYQRD
jgi:uncharacterized protein (DUF934 family)